MHRNPSGRLALIISLLALVVALAGTSYAALSIGTKQLKKNAVTSPKIKNNAVTGQDVKESSLGKVPVATAAETIGGLRIVKVAFDTTATTPTVVFSGVGLTLTANCAGANDPTLTATTTKQDSAIYSSLVDLEDTLAPINAELEPGEFDTTTTFDVLAGADTSEEDPSLVHLAYDAPDGSIAFGTFTVEDACSVYGTVTFG